MLCTCVMPSCHHGHRALEWSGKESPELGLNLEFFLCIRLKAGAIFCSELCPKDLHIHMNSMVLK